MDQKLGCEKNMSHKEDQKPDKHKNKTNKQKTPQTKATQMNLGGLQGRMDDLHEGGGGATRTR